MRQYFSALGEALAPAVGVSPETLTELFTSPPDDKMGDIALPCFGLAKSLRQAPPRIAASLAEVSLDSLGWVASAEATGPYLNIRLDPASFAKRILDDLREGGTEYGSSDTGLREDGSRSCVVIDFSSPNIAKQLAVHHLRSTMIGNSIARLHRACGFQVVGINHLGDWGTSYGKLLAAWERFGDPLETAGDGDPLEALHELYVRFHKEEEGTPELSDEARAWFQKLEAGDAVARERWKTIRSASLTRFEEVYSRLGVEFDEVIGESFFEDKMQPVVDELEEKGLLVESEEAMVVRLDDLDLPPVLIRKRDGASLYHTRDLAAAEYRWDTWQFDRCLYVVDSGQGLHFRQLFEVLSRMGRDYATRMEHVNFGVLRLPVEGSWVRGKTRQGTVVLLEKVLDAARDMAREKILQKSPDLVSIEDAAEAVGMAAVVFADLKARRIKDVNFDLEQITSFEGETGAYLEYTHARFCSLLRRFEASEVAEEARGCTSVPGSRLVKSEELALFKKMAQFQEIIIRAAAEAEPSLVSTYLLELASLFNSYYADRANRIVGEDPELTRDRVALVTGLKTVLGNGLRLLGIRPLERM